jgi:high affinity Mn2+ porin
MARTALVHGALLLALCWASQGTAFAQAAAPQAPATPTPVSERWSLHLQATNTQQYHGAFPAAYSGPQSLSPQPDTQKSFDFTVFFGGRLWKGAEFYVDQEVDQGFALGNPGPDDEYNGTFGVAGFVNGEAGKVGEHKPYSRTQRYFIRQIFNIGGDWQTVDPDQNQLGEAIRSAHLILTFGKFAVTDVFDTNPYAHDSKNDFLNWSIIDMGAFDYAADAWGYTRGLSAELTRGPSTLRAGIFQLSLFPNVAQLETSFLRQFSPIVEYERRTSLFGGHPGSVKALVYGDYGYMAAYADATATAAGTGMPPSFAAVRTQRHWKIGEGINVAQELAPHVGFFSRLSAMNGTYEPFEYTEIDRSVLVGLSLDGGTWHRPNDTIGLADVHNALSSPAQQYYAAGGLGIVIGDGALSYGGEHIFESYYKIGFGPDIAATFDYQRVVNPGYNAVRGPVSIYGLRLHAQI